MAFDSNREFEYFWIDDEGMDSEIGVELYSFYLNEKIQDNDKIFKKEYYKFIVDNGFNIIDEFLRDIIEDTYWEDWSLDDRELFRCYISRNQLRQEIDRIPQDLSIKVFLEEYLYIIEEYGRDTIEPLLIINPEVLEYNIGDTIFFLQGKNIKEDTITRINLRDVDTNSGYTKKYGSFSRDSNVFVEAAHNNMQIEINKIRTKITKEEETHRKKMLKLQNDLSVALQR